MANSDSSAIVRFVAHAQAEPILETKRPPRPDTVPTEIAQAPKQHSLKGFFVTGLVAAALGIGGAFYLAETGTQQAATSARAGLAGVSKDDRSASPAALATRDVPPEPSAAPVALPAAEPEPEQSAPPAAPTPEVEPIEAAVAPAVEAESESEPAPAVQEETVEESEPAVAVEPTRKAKPSAKKKSTKAKRRAKKARVSKRPRKATKSVASASGGKGTLMLGAKPPCRIYIDGRDTGKMTPQRAISLPAGKHKIMLLNREYNLKSRATVVIKAGKKTRIIRDLSNRI